MVDLAHQLLAQRVQPGDVVVDATCGKGHDTLFLARAVGPGGRVYAFDIQAAAIQASRERFKRPPGFSASFFLSSRSQ